jgi:carboxyl-terminal processing protease
MSGKTPSQAYWLPLLVFGALAIGFYLGHRANPWEVTASEQQEAVKFNGVLNYIEKNYVDEISRNDLVDKSIASMLEQLDPHSSYIPASELERVNERLEGRFEGIGVRFLIHRDTLVVTNIIPGGPSEKAGLMPGDRIVKVDNKEINDSKLDTDKVQKLLKGKTGSVVNLQVERFGKTENVKIVRGPVYVSSVDAAFMIDEKVGYIRINTFSESTVDEFVMSGRRLRNQGMKKLILDLRDNGGGYLTAATAIADEFLSNGKLIVYTKGNARDRKDTYATSKGFMEDIDLAILINEQSASASEIVAGAIQDNDRGTIIGRRSFGKGLVQEQHQWQDGSAIRLTIARYYTPTGRSIQRPYGKDIDYEQEFYDRYENGELYNIDSSVFVDSLKYTTPGGKIVYGGGGIMPDIFIPADSSGQSHFYSILRYNDVFSHFAFSYLDSARTRMQQKDYKDFIGSFVVDGKLLNTFTRYASEEFNIQTITSQLRKSEDRIKIQIITALCRSMWEEEGMMYAAVPYDNEIQKAIKVLSESSRDISKK